MSPYAARVLFLCTGNYYRSRFAEIVFNHKARRLNLPHRATSAGLAPNCGSRNRGPLSPHTIAALEAMGISPGELREPRDVTLQDLERATEVVAMKDAEHRPMMTQLFPTWVDRIQYWSFHDIQDQSPLEVLPAIEAQLDALLQQLSKP